MDVNSFANEMVSNITDFAEFWAKRSAEDPNCWPMDLQKDEWAEEFAAWLDNSKNCI